MQVLGVDLGGTNLRVGLVENEKIIRVEETPVINTENADDILNCIYGLIDGFLSTDIKGIGIGVPSVVDPEKGIVYEVQNIPSWKEVYLKDLLQKRYNIPVYVNNDANCFAAGEKYFGKAKNYSDAVGLILGTGLGAGLILNNKLYSGPNNGAGEFGLIPYKDKNYEAYCSGQFFNWKYNTKGSDLYKRAVAGESDAIDIFTELGSHIGEVIKAVLYAVDPEIIILGGSVSKSFRFYQKQIWNSLETFTFPNTINNLKIEASEIEQVAILGSAALYYEGNYK